MQFRVWADPGRSPPRRWMRSPIRRFGIENGLSLGEEAPPFPLSLTSSSHAPSPSESACLPPGGRLPLRVTLPRFVDAVSSLLLRRRLASVHRGRAGGNRAAWPAEGRVARRRPRGCLIASLPAYMGAIRRLPLLSPGCKGVGRRGQSLSRQLNPPAPWVPYDSDERLRRRVSVTIPRRLMRLVETSGTGTIWMPLSAARGRSSAALPWKSRS